MMPQKKKSLGEELVEEGILTAQQLASAQAEEKKTGQRLHRLLVRLGYISEEDLVDFISGKLSLPRIEIGSTLLDPATTDLIPEELARKHELIPILKIGNRLTCAMVDPWNIFAMDEVREKTNLIVEPAVATPTEVKKALDQYYGTRGSLEELLQNMNPSKLGLKQGEEADAKKLAQITEEPVVIKMVNLMLMQAIKERASDIHIEPEEEELKLRFRIDGMLHDIPSPPKYLQSAVISRIKIMANLDIAERRIPQDGRFNVSMEGKKVDVRVSSVPMIHGENVVLRLLETSSALLSLEELGFSQETLVKYERLIHRPHGLILVTGPTGSGKTTTLYASLEKLNSVEKNIITIEDPVEYKLKGIRQIQLNPKVNLTFANGLRSILRQDPDIVMVGEIRDRETSEIAIHAALTGHLVFSTLHTNEAAGAITRLIDMGVDPFLVSSSLIGVLAQRLVRTLCKNCKEEITLTDEMLKRVGLKRDSRFYKGKGCQDCLNTGYKGRISIFELLAADEPIQNLIVAKSTSRDIRRSAEERGMRSLKEDGLTKVLAGLTTLEEVLRVTEEE